MFRILIVEDEQLIQDMYTRVFHNAGYEVDTSADGVDALKKLSENVYDMVLLDIMLPKVSGMEVLKKIRTKDSKAYNTPVYLITNLGQESYVADCIKMGANGYLLKSHYTPEDLLKEIDSHLKSNMPQS